MVEKKKQKKNSKNKKSRDFSSKETAKSKEEIEFNFNLKDVKSFFKKNKNIFLKLIPILLILILMFYSAYIRTGTVTLSGLKENVRSNVLNNVKYMIEQQVSQEYPNLNNVYKQEEVNKRFEQVLRSGVINIGNQTILIDQLVEQNFNYIKNKFQIDNQTYLTAIDPYMYYRRSSNILENGHQGETLKINPETGKEQPFDSYRLAPIGSFVSEKPDLHTYLEYLLYKFSGLNKDSPISEKFRAIFLLPVILVILSVIPAFLLMRKLTNDYSAFLGSLILFSIGTFVSRTVAGFVDTDGYVVLFPLIIVAFSVYSLFTKNKKLSIIYSLLSGLFIAIFLWAWGSGWFIFVFLTLSYISYLGYKVLIKIISPKKVEFNFNIIHSFLVFLISSIFFTFLITGQNLIISSLKSIYNNLSNIASVSTTYIWPNVYSSVAELNPASMNNIISSIGGKLVFLISLLGIFHLVYNSAVDFKKKYKNINIAIYIFTILWFFFISFKNAFINYSNNSPLTYLILIFIPIGIAFIANLLDKKTTPNLFFGILISIWLAGTIYMSLNGVRFILLLATPVAISFALGVYYICKSFNEFLVKETSLKKDYFISNIVFFFVFLLIFIPMFQQANAISKGTTPNMTDGWYDSLTKIKNESEKNAIITSWWDFGHEFAAIADRGVTFDGASQTTPRSHWVGKILMENDNEMVLGILRMLVCSGNEAFNYIENITNPKDKGVNILESLLYKILPYDLTDEERKEIINNYPYYDFNEEQTNKIIELVNCKNPPNDYFITSEDMVGKSGVWAHWGSWNFTKKFVYDNYKKLTPEETAKILDRNLTEIKKLYDELSEIDFKAEVEGVKRENLINQWLADYPSYIQIQGQDLFDCKAENNVINCNSLGITFNLKTEEIKLFNPSFNELGVKRIIYPTSGNKLNVINITDNGQLDITLIPISKNNYKILLSIYPLGNSLFTKLFYLEGYGIEGFEKFKKVNTIQGWKVITWKVDWDNVDMLYNNNSEEKIINESLNLIEENETEEINDLVNISEEEIINESLNLIDENDTVELE